MDRIRLKDKEFELFIPEEEIKDAIAKVAERIREDVKGTNPLFVGILNGAFMFTTHGNEWIACLTIAAILELYTAFRIPQEEAKL